MGYVLGSMLASASLMLLFKAFERYKIDVFQTIVVNYIVASLIALVFSSPIDTAHLSPGFLGGMLLIGALFIGIFNLIGYSIARIGVAPVSVAQKTSLIIPVVYGIVLLGEPAGIYRYIGLLIAIIAIYLSTKGVAQAEPSKGDRNWLWILLIFTGSGFVDSFIKHIQNRYVQPETAQLFIAGTYAACSIIGLIIWAVVSARGKLVFSAKNILAGIILGIPNYLSMFFFVKSLALPWMNISVFFPLNNLGIITISTFCSYLFFKEKISKQQWLGIALTGLAIMLLSL